MAMDDWTFPSLSGLSTDCNLKILIVIIFGGLTRAFESPSAFWCIRHTSAITFSVMEHLIKIPAALIAIVWFGAPTTYDSKCALTLLFVAGLAYTLARYHAIRGNIGVAALQHAVGES